MEAQIRRQPDGIISPEVLEDNSVTFRVKAKDAGSVQLTGTWPVNFEQMVPMEKTDSTLYEVTIGPLPSDMYEYEFVIDGVPVLDPRNKAVTHDGAWIQNRLVVPGKQAELWVHRHQVISCSHQLSYIETIIGYMCQATFIAVFTQMIMISIELDTGGILGVTNSIACRFQGQAGFLTNDRYTET